MNNMPGRGTPKFGIRVSEETWQQFGEAVAAQGKDRSTVLREFMAWFLRQPPEAKLPPRP